jgi:hypothetical protein
MTRIEIPRSEALADGRAEIPGRRPLATVEDLAAHYAVSPHTIRRWHYTGTEIGPLMFRRGKYLRARWADIEAADAQKAGGSAA